MTARIIIVGGHGKIALLAIPLLRAAGHHVTAMIRNPDHANDVAEAGATPLVLDIEAASELDIADAFGGHDVVIWSAGAGGGNPARTNAVDRDAAILSMDAAQKAQARRYLMVSYSGSGIDEVPESSSFHTYAVAKALADEYLRTSALDWTILGPSRLTDDPPTGRLETSDHHGEVSRADVAATLAAAVTAPASIGRTIRFSNGDTPIDEVVATNPS